MSSRQDLVLYAGETRTLTMQARDASNNVQDLTNMDITWRAGIVLYEPDQTQPVLEKTATIISATAGTFSVTLDPSDTMPLKGLFVYDAYGTVDGAITFIDDNGDPITFIDDDGDELIFVSDNDQFIQVLVQGSLNIIASVRQ